MLAPLLLSFALTTLNAPSSPLLQDVDVRAEFVRIHAAEGTEALRALWEAYPGRVLGSIDEDLEGSLAIWEAAKGGELSVSDMAVIHEQQERALWGAAIASEVTGDAIFIDYTSSFVGWSDEEKRSFRAGQAFFAQARKDMAAGEWDAALEAGQQCTQLALQLGDWWGVAMGLSAEARASLGQGKAVAAIAPASRARLLYQQLGLTASELNAIQTMLTALEELGRQERALACADAAVALAVELGDSDAAAAFTARRDALK
ncbi:MAG: hypothetical protein P8N09_02890 [Planctomycetota bacterium]|nr:hypothetical protein [Planctomycetota bacterium]